MFLWNADQMRGYERARADLASMIGAAETAQTAQNLQHRHAINRLVAQINATNAVNQDLQSRLQASEECVRFLDQSNTNLCAELLELSARLDDWKAYGEKSQAIMAQQNAEIVELKTALARAQYNMKALTTDDPF